MSLKFYQNATDGAKDGTLISSSDGTAPVIFDGMYPGASTVSKTISIAIRADAGEVWRFVNLTCKGTSLAKFKLDGTNLGSYGSAKLWVDVQPARSCFIRKVTDTNIVFSVTAEASPSDTGSPDTSVSLVAWGWRVS